MKMTADLRENAMTTLTSEQHQAVERAGDQPVPGVDAQSQIEYYLVRADLFQEMSEPLEEERQRHVIAQMAKRNAAARMNESPCGDRPS
jgi:hypothetical protein